MGTMTDFTCWETFGPIWGYHQLSRVREDPEEALSSFPFYSRRSGAAHGGLGRVVEAVGGQKSPGAGAGAGCHAPDLLAELDSEVVLPPQSSWGVSPQDSTDSLASGFCSLCLTGLPASGLFSLTPATIFEGSESYAERFTNVPQDSP